MSVVIPVVAVPVGVGRWREGDSTKSRDSQDQCFERFHNFDFFCWFDGAGAPFVQLLNRPPWPGWVLLDVC
jgi:hypothetical protein